MPLRSDPLDRLAVPDGTTVEERDLVTAGDVVVGGQSTVEFGVRGRGVVAGERVTFGGDIEAEADCRLDMWCDVAGNVLVGEDAYIGERTHIGGQLMVSGDLDIGDDVDIERGFEANGWIVIRNPMPTITFFFVYLSHLLRIGEEEAAQDAANELLSDDEGDESEGEESDADVDDADAPTGPAPLVIPRGASVSDDAWRVSTPAFVGDDCRIHGNLRAASLDVGEDNNVFGSLRAKGDITVGEGTRIHGDVTTRKGTVRIAPGAEVLGDVACEDLSLHDDAAVDGAIRARGEMSIVREFAREIE
ncbi:polymer-forming cytoskeletal protein [Halomarina oriensis]|uniref:Acyltransferase n=1 Tax=Halomarina oriensis TaxID=671145 RepID=A0A6B0GFJ4_9EURY|nr:acyltransferase [Halomarina oriensis]